MSVNGSFGGLQLQITAAESPQSREGGFSSKKDLARHESKHNPRIHCSQKGYTRVFSRGDNMKDPAIRNHWP